MATTIVFMMMIIVIIRFIVVAIIIINTFVVIATILTCATVIAITTQHPGILPKLSSRPKERPSPGHPKVSQPRLSSVPAERADLQDAWG